MAERERYYPEICEYHRPSCLAACSIALAGASLAPLGAARAAANGWRYGAARQFMHESQILPLDEQSTQRYNWVVIPAFDQAGNLPPGVHWTTWQEFAERFGTTPWRQTLLRGLRAALESLREGGCSTAYVGGSFVTAKVVPGDFDACWEVDGVDPYRLDPVLLKFDDGRAAQKAKYLGELFPVGIPESGSGLTFLEFFQVDKETGEGKGVIALDLRRLA